MITGVIYLHPFLMPLQSHTSRGTHFLAFRYLESPNEVTRRLLGKQRIKAKGSGYFEDDAIHIIVRIRADVSRSDCYGLPGFENQCIL